MTKGAVLDGSAGIWTTDEAAAFLAVLDDLSPVKALVLVSGRRRV
jgi:hypothetical protein